MVYSGHVQNGVVVFDQPVTLPNGTEVKVQVVTPANRKTLAERFEGLIGAVSDLPEDLAAQHDHYVHGTPKK